MRGLGGWLTQGMTGVCLLMQELCVYVCAITTCFYVFGYAGLFTCGAIRNRGVAQVIASAACCVWLRRVFFLSSWLAHFCFGARIVLL